MNEDVAGLSGLHSTAIEITEMMLGHGYFIRDDESLPHFFDKVDGKLIPLKEDDWDLRSLLSDRYQLNRTVRLYSYLVDHLHIEARARGQERPVRYFCHYDKALEVVYLDMGQGRLLRISAGRIDIVANGNEEVLFLTRNVEPWDYVPETRPWLLYDKVVAPVSFTGSTAQRQRRLFLIWLMSMVFRTVVPKRPIAVFTGPGASGKSTILQV